MSSTLDKANSFYESGNSWLGKKEYDKAIEDYSKAIELKPDFLSAIYNRGSSWDEKGNYDKAIEDFTRVIELKPDHHSAYNNRGISWKRKGNFEKAIEDYTTAIGLKPDYANAFYNRANSWRASGNYDKSIEDYTRAIELQPNDAGIFNNRGISWKSKGNSDKALEDYNKAIDLKPDYANAFYNREIIWENKGEYEKGISDLYDYLKYTDNKTDYWAEKAKTKITQLNILIKDKKLGEISEIITKVKKLLLFESGCITHYTGLSIAKHLLLEKSPFRISEAAFLNDTSEGRELYDYLDVKFSKIETNGTIAENFTQRPFIGSFVEENLHDNLNLWRMYGKDNKEEAKGCALTIKADLFIQSINLDKTAHEVNTLKTADDINFYRVAYRQNNEKLQFTVPSFTTKANQKFNELIDKLKFLCSAYNKNNIDLKDLEGYLNSIAYLFKSDVYKSENELRLVVNGTGFDKVIDTMSQPPRVFIELLDLKPIIKRITLGPKIERPDEWAATFFYSYDKEDIKPEIMISHLPFK